MGRRDKRRRSLVVAVGASVVAALQAACGASATESTSDAGVRADAEVEEIAFANEGEGVMAPVFPKAIQQPVLQTGANNPEVQPVAEDTPCIGNEGLDEPVMIRGEPVPLRPDVKIRPLMGKPGPAMMTGGLAAYPDD